MFQSVVIFASWLLIKEGIVSIFLGHYALEILNDASSHGDQILAQLDSDESQGSSGEEEDGDIFQNNERYQYTTSADINNTRYKRSSHSFRITCQCAQ